MKKLVKAVSLDIEGCITSSGGGKQSWPTEMMFYLACLLLSAKARMGIQFFVNSGRGGQYVEAVLQALELVVYSTPSIFENGSGIYFPDTKDFMLNPAITDEKLSAFQEIKKVLIKITAELDGIQELGKDFSFSASKPVGMSITEYFKLFRQKLLKQAGIEKTIEMTHSQSSADFTVRGVNKQTGLEFWCRKTGIKLEELAAIGDSRGDLPVLKIVRLPMCPSNSTDDVVKLVRDRGGYVSCYQATLGVVDCIAHAVPIRMSKKPEMKSSGTLPSVSRLNFPISEVYNTAN